MTWVVRQGSLSLSPFLRNKLAQTLVAILRYEYPAAWPTFFQDLLGLVRQGGEPPDAPGITDIFCRCGSGHSGGGGDSSRQQTHVCYHLLPGGMMSCG